MRRHGIAKHDFVFNLNDYLLIELTRKQVNKSDCIIEMEMNRMESQRVFSAYPMRTTIAMTYQMNIPLLIEHSYMAHTTNIESASSSNIWISNRCSSFCFLFLFFFSKKCQLCNMHSKCMHHAFKLYIWNQIQMCER